MKGEALSLRVYPPFMDACSPFLYVRSEFKIQSAGCRVPC